MIYVVLFLPRLPSLIVYLGYDLKCAINELTTFANCTQEFLVQNPKNWVFYSKAISGVSSLLLLFIIWCNRKKLKCNFSRPFKLLIYKSSFWRTNGLFAFTFAYYIIRIDGSTDGSITILVYFAETFCVVVALTLAAKMNIIPMLQGRSVDYKIQAFASLVIMIRVAFASQMLAFFWHKIFYGRKDFF